MGKQPAILCALSVPQRSIHHFILFHFYGSRGFGFNPRFNKSCIILWTNCFVWSRDTTDVVFGRQWNSRPAMQVPGAKHHGNGGCGGGGKRRRREALNSWWRDRRPPRTMTAEHEWAGRWPSAIWESPWPACVTVTRRIVTVCYLAP